MFHQLKNEYETIPRYGLKIVNAKIQIYRPTTVTETKHAKSNENGQIFAFAKHKQIKIKDTYF